MLEMAKEILKVSRDETFGQRLRQLRKNRGLTQVRLAEQVSSSQRAICSYEQDRTDPPLYVIPKLADALDVTVEDLLGLNGRPVKKRGSRDSFLVKKIEEISQLPDRKQRTILQVINLAMKST